MTSKFVSLSEKYSALIKVGTIGFLVLVLIIPTAMIMNLISERQARRNEATNEVSSKWGNEQTLVGPVLSVPFTTYDVNKFGEKENVKSSYAFFLPEDLKFTGNILPEIRYRGIFQIVVYNAKLHCEGFYNKPDMQLFHEKNIDIKWNDAFITFGINDMRGIKESIGFLWNNNNLNCEPGTKVKDIINAGFTVKLPDFKQKPDSNYQFAFDISLNGSKKLFFTPLGKLTQVDINSTWNNPSFDGSFLPNQREVTDKGFTASWKVLEFNRNFPQQWIDKDVDFTSAAFGVGLLLPVDGYQTTERSVKYAVLFIILTFTVFFFIEILRKLKVHPIQYVLIGFGLCLFYLLLLSLTEQIKFEIAYLIASFSIIVLIVAYSVSIFKNKKLTIILTSILITLYGFLYILLQLQDYALLFGSLGLFIILATVMYLSRKIDWYSLSKQDGEQVLE